MLFLQSMASDEEDEDGDEAALGDNEDEMFADMSDVDVSEDDEPPRRGRGRPRKSGQGQTGAAGPSGRGRGQHRSREHISPQAELNRADRARRRPQSLEEEQRAERERAKQEKKRKRELFEKTAAEQFNFTGEFHVRSLVNSIAEKFKSGCCAAFVTPMAPRVLAGNTINLPFQCTECGEAWDVQTGAKVRINLFCDGDEDSEDEDEQPRLNSRGRKIAKRKQTNSRNETNVRAVIAALLSGQTYTEYKASQLARDERYM